MKNKKSPINIDSSIFPNHSNIRNKNYSFQIILQNLPIIPFYREIKLKIKLSRFIVLSYKYFERTTIKRKFPIQLRNKVSLANNIVANRRGIRRHVDRSNRAKVALKNPQGVDPFDRFGQVHWFHPNLRTIKNRCKPTIFSRVFTLSYIAFTFFHLNYLNIIRSHFQYF